MPRRAVHDQGEFAVGDEWEQDVYDVLLGELSIVEDPGDRVSLGFKTGFVGQMGRDLAV